MGEPRLQRRLQRIARGMKLTPAQMRELDERLDLRPQQGFAFSSQEYFAQYAKVLDEKSPELVVMDSLSAFQTGNEMDNTARRDFYNRVIAPFRARHNCAFLLLGHPPLPAKDAHQGARKRVRGGGDAMAFADRNWSLEKLSEERTEEDHIVRVNMGELNAREGGAMDDQLVEFRGLENQPMVIRALEERPERKKGANRVSDCQEVILETLREKREEMYQPDLIELCGHRGFGKDVYQSAANSLASDGAISIEPPKPGSGKSGKWVRLKGG